MIPVTRPELPPLEEYVALLRDIWDSHMLSNFGPHAARFEARAQACLGTPRVRCVASGDVGLVIALSALDLPEGGEAIVPSFTFNSTVNAVRWNRLVPVFADIDPATLNVDPADVERLVGPRTAVIVATHVFGNPCDADELRRIAAARGVPIVYDAAHAFGSRYRSRPVGTLGDLEVFSFSGTKLVTSAEGGLVAAATDELVRRVEYGRAYGFQADYESHFPGLNGKLSELNAALGVLTVRLVEPAATRRAAIARRYRDHLAGLPGVAFQQVDPRDRSTYKDFAILCAAGRDALEARLAAEDIQTKRYFRPCHTMRAFRRWATRPLPRTDETYARILCLPIFNELPDEDVDRIAGIVRAHFTGSGSG
jgi:dTDP-4-amino-4,6-dideoxygalactose transaminase